jgi:hypothetical protein
VVDDLRTDLDQLFLRLVSDQSLNIAPATEVEQIVFAVTPDSEACRLLEIDAEEPCLLLSRRTWVGGAPATKSLFTYPGSRYSLDSRYKVANGARGSSRNNLMVQCDFAVRRDCKRSPEAVRCEREAIHNV